MEKRVFRIYQRLARRIIVTMGAAVLILWLIPARLDGLRQFGIAIGVIAFVGWSLYLLPKWSSLSIDDDGINVSMPLWSQFIAWSSVQRFDIISTKISILGRLLVPEHAVGYFANTSSPLLRVRGARLCRWYYGCDGMLPFVDGISAEELLAELNSRLAQLGPTDDSQPPPHL